MVRRQLARLMSRINFSRAFWSSRAGRGIIASAAVFLLLFLSIALYYYLHFSALIRQRLAGNIYQNTSQVYSIPRRISVGEVWSAVELVNYLQSSGYSDTEMPGSAGRYEIVKSTVEIRPGIRSFFAGENALAVEFSGRRISRLRLLGSGRRAAVAEIEPELITNLFDIERQKRRPVRYEDLPKVLVQAILSAEDKRFFDHPGLDPIRILGAAWADLRHAQKAQGASTISMQVARTFFFDTRREWSRKIKETLMALMLENRFSKKQIFELYANQVYLGNRGSFAIRGFGEAAASYLGKDVREVNLAEAAFLAGIIRAPNRYSAAERRPERAAEARDHVLVQMLDNKQVTAEDVQKAKKAPLRIISPIYGGTLSAYFIDMIKDDLLERFSESDLISRSFRIYTELDPALQKAATQAVEWGMKNVDSLLARRYAQWRKKGEEVPLPQVALVALDPHSGEVKALVGGRDYASSQLNHALAQRQPGSVFKPFVYAAAFQSGIDGAEPVLTPLTPIVDEPTTFMFDGQEYTPNNYGENFFGRVTLREALTRSLNVATVKVAELAGYKKVADLAKMAGLSEATLATPAVALGAYEATPMEMAGAYTVFSNGGIRSEPQLLHSVVGPGGEIVEQSSERHATVLDPRVAYLVTNILEDVINVGTAAGVRVRGFSSPAAGKTGTSRDGWFAGYTSNLLCVVWVGFDDNRELGLSGAASAAPIWTEFIKRAVTFPRYRDTQAFERPEGVVFVAVDPESHQLAGSNCPISREEVFIAGTEPAEHCSIHDGGGLLRWVMGLLPRFKSRRGSPR